MKILLTGATGLLGSYLEPALRASSATVVPVSHTSPPLSGGVNCDLTDPEATARLLDVQEPDVIVHAAALTNVDRCETEPDVADRMNRLSTELLAAAPARLVFISTDSVFDGTRGGYSEDDEPAPVNEYARSKLRAEEHVLATASGVCVRTNFFGRSSRGHGLAEWLLRELEAEREVVGFEDVVFSPLYCRDVAHALVEIALGDVTGLLHLGGPAVNKYDFGVLVAERFGLDPSLVKRGSIAEVALRAPRPLDTSLDSARAHSLLETPLHGVEEAVSAMARDEPVPGRALS
ncbi:MAG: SDR family oxidoreductase [Thermoleophilia bacterium]|nr:SDR family oxidoreductase [Thermoleophilia bacterium]